MINFSYQHSKYVDIFDEHFIRSWIKKTISIEQKAEGEIQYVFCDDEKVHTINKSFLDHDTYTDIISFPTTEVDEIISGEIYISIERVMENSKTHGTKFDTELRRVIIHGILHFLGYDDHSHEDKQRMRDKEDYYLNLLP